MHENEWFYSIVNGGFLVLQVMFRMNFLVIMLCFVMNRPYQFYYFVPLVSFWFVIIYLTMAIWPHITAASTDGEWLLCLQISGTSYILLRWKFMLIHCKWFTLMLWNYTLNFFKWLKCQTLVVSILNCIGIADMCIIRIFTHISLPTLYNIGKSD